MILDYSLTISLRLLAASVATELIRHVFEVAPMPFALVRANIEARESRIVTEINLP